MDRSQEIIRTSWIGIAAKMLPLPANSLMRYSPLCQACKLPLLWITITANN